MSGKWWKYMHRRKNGSTVADARFQKYKKKAVLKYLKMLDRYTED